MLVTVEPKLPVLEMEELWLAEDSGPVGDEYEELRATEEVGAPFIGDVLSVPACVEDVLLPIFPGVVAAPVFKHEHADEILEGESWHCETYVGRSAVAAFCDKVYVAQNGPTMEEDRMNSRRQLS